MTENYNRENDNFENENETCERYDAEVINSEENEVEKNIENEQFNKNVFYDVPAESENTEQYEKEQAPEYKTASDEENFEGEGTWSYRYKRGDAYPIVVPSFKKKVTREKKKSSKTWLVAMVSAIAGALIFSVVSPFISGVVDKVTDKPFSLNIAEGNKAETTKITYNAEDRKVLSTVDIGKLVGPSVVGIVSTVEYQGFFSQEVTSGNGSGIIFSADGHIVTNHHVIEGAKSVKVVLNTGKEYDAKLIGSDAKTDLAVIKIEAEDLQVATFGDSTSLEAGEKVVAIGNPLGLEFAGSLTQGIISAVNRTVTVDQRTYKMIQTDAAINPGNSGGALVNEFGEVIGINSVKVSSSGVEGLGFAIPVSDAKPIIEDLINFGYVKGRPLIGLSLRYVTEQEAYYYNFPSKGLFVVEVTPGTGAEKAGIQKGDIILSCDGKEVEGVEALNEIRDTHKAGDTIKLKINRNGKEMEIPVVLGEDTTKAQ